MFQNYFKIAIRNLMKHKIYSLISVLGLTIGLTCSMVIMIFVLDEFSYDRFNKKADRIYRLGREVKSAEGEMREPLSSAPTAKVLLQDYPEVENVVRLRGMGKPAIRYENKKFYQGKVYYADASVFDVFTCPMIKGDRQKALTKPYSVVITEEMAEKYFGRENPMGKILKFNNQYDFIVTGVIENMPENTHRKMNILCSFETLYAQQHPSLDDWLSFDYYTYILLRENGDYQNLEQKFSALIDRYIRKDLKSLESTLNFYLHPLTKIHLYSHLDGNSPGLISQVYYLSMFAIFIVIIASINFMNLTTARSGTRAKEVGLRKVIGAHRHTLIKQFLSEALLISLFALALALLLTELILPHFGTIIDHDLKLDFFESLVIFPGFIGLAIVIGLLSGSYPAFYLSRFQPVQVIQGSIKVSMKKSKIRGILVVLQFIISTILICHTSILNNQINYLKNKDIGFHKKHIVVLPVVDDEIRQSLRSIKKELRDLPQVINVTATSNKPGFGIPRNVKIPVGYSRTQVQLMDDIDVDQDFIPTLGIEIVAGRNFSKHILTDQQNAIIINETAARKFGWTDPIGKTIQYSIGQDDYATGIVIGMVKDFHLASLHRLIEPLYISNNPTNLKQILVRIRPENVTNTVERLKETWNKMYPDHPFQYSFLEDSYDRYFRTLDSVFEVFSTFAILAILLACTGILALAAFIAEQRTKEIGIRKVLGDTTFGITVRLNIELLKYVLISTLIVIPHAYFSFVNFDQFFPYVADINVMIYIKAAVLVFLIALGTISCQSIRAAMANPVDSLKYE